MKAIEQTGYLFANEAGSWPGFATFQMNVATDGSLQLAVAAGGFQPTGAFFGGPFEALSGPTPWFRMAADMPALPEGTHLQLFAFGSDGAAPLVTLNSDSPFAGWAAGPPDTLEWILPSTPRRQLCGLAWSQHVFYTLPQDKAADQAADAKAKELAGEKEATRLKQFEKFVENASFQKRSAD